MISVKLSVIAKPVFFCQTADDGAQRCESFKVALPCVLNSNSGQKEMSIFN